MALFARKSKTSADDAVVVMPTAPSSNGATGTDDSDTSTADLRASQGATGRLKKGAKRPKASRASTPSRGPRGIKGGAVVGLNIGNDSIKAIEVRGKGSQIVVTAAGQISTPAESLSNGLIMSPAALSSAIRELFAQSGIRTKSAITSISGGGALVVRVLEVPKMSDAELEENMNMDLERYIPFPPTDVVKDFRALRELPSDPDAPNMEVLLAAAQNETVELHLKVLQGAKLDPQAIDVEPLAAARAVFYGSTLNGDGGLTPEIATDYNDATALINIGATNTEISVLRGDVLVFTRAVPNAGNALTQTLADHLGLTWPDAERLKREMGDALPPAVTPNAAAESGADEDWSAFGDDQMTSIASENATNDAADTSSVAVVPTPLTADTSSVSTTATEATSSENVASGEDAAFIDPFDTAMFNQGPRQNEPQEGHLQKQDDASSQKPSPDFDLSRFNFTEEEREVDDGIPTDPLAPEGNALRQTTFAATASSTGSTDVTSAPQPVADAGSAGADEPGSAPSGNAPSGEQNLPTALTFPMAGEDDDLTSMAPSGQMYGAGSADDPELPSFPSLPSIAELSTASAAARSDAAPLIFSDGLLAPGAEGHVGDEDEDSLPTVSDEMMQQTIDVDDLSSLPTMGATTSSRPTNVDVPGETTSLTPGASSATGAPVFDFSAASAQPQSSNDDFESAFASMIAAPAAIPITPAANPTVDAPTADERVLGAMAPILTPGSITSPYAVAPTGAAASVASDFDLDQFAATTSIDDSFGLQDFGLGLGGEEETTPASVHAILQPRLAELVNEIRRSLEYYASRYPDAGVRRIVLVGGGALLPNMDAMLTQEIGIPATVQNPLGHVNVEAKGLSPEFIEKNGAGFAVALGLALRDVVV